MATKKTPVDNSAEIAGNITQVTTLISMMGNAPDIQKDAQNRLNAYNKNNPKGNLAGSKSLLSQVTTLSQRAAKVVPKNTAPKTTVPTKTPAPTTPAPQPSPSATPPITTPTAPSSPTSPPAATTPPPDASGDTVESVTAQIVAIENMYPGDTSKEIVKRLTTYIHTHRTQTVAGLKEILRQATVLGQRAQAVIDKAGGPGLTKTPNPGAPPASPPPGTPPPPDPAIADSLSQIQALITQYAGTKNGAEIQTRLNAYNKAHPTPTAAGMKTLLAAANVLAGRAQKELDAKAPLPSPTAGVTDSIQAGIDAANNTANTLQGGLDNLSNAFSGSTGNLADASTAADTTLGTGGADVLNQANPPGSGGDIGGLASAGGLGTAGDTSGASTSTATASASPTGIPWLYIAIGVAGLIVVYMVIKHRKA
jgi:hypothetical protein